MQFQRNSAAPPSAISKLSPTTLTRLPGDYLKFVELCDGGEGFIGDNYVILWGIESLEEYNRDYEVHEYIPDVLLFGSNGGGEAYGFMKSESGFVVVRVPFVGMCPQLCVEVAQSFADFVQDAGA